MNKRVLAGLCLAVGLSVCGWWATTSRQLFTLNNVQHIEKVKDDFGEMVEKVTWVDKFEPGLLDVVLPVDGFLTAAAALLLVLDLRARKKQAQAPT